MVEAGKEPEPSDSGLRPMVDYGRCCWCALCVDICPSGSLGMSNNYTWIDTDPDGFRYIPGVCTKDWDDSKKGWRKEEGFDLVNPKRVPMPLLDGEERIKHWLGHGAKPTDRVLRFLDEAGIAKREARNNPNKAQPGKKAMERIEAAKQADEEAKAKAEEEAAAAKAAEEEAKAAASQLVEVARSEMKSAGVPAPESWLSFVAEKFPYREKADLEHLLNGLRKAGLPD